MHFRMKCLCAVALVLTGGALAACSSGKTGSALPLASTRAGNSSTQPLRTTSPNSAAPNKLPSQHGFPIKTYAFSIADDPHDSRHYSIVTVSESVKLTKTANPLTSFPRPGIKKNSSLPSTYNFRVKKNGKGEPLLARLSATRSKPLDAGADGCSPSDIYATPGLTNTAAWVEPDPDASHFPGTLTENDLANVPGLTVTMNPSNIYSSSDISQETITVPNNFPINQYYTDVMFTSAQGLTGSSLATVQIAYPLDAPTVNGDSTVNVNAGDTATFNFSQDLVPNGGPLSWLVWSSIPDLSTSTWGTEQTTAPHANTLSIQTDKYTPPGMYAIGVEVQSSEMCESSPLTTTVYVNVTSQLPPPPTVDQATNSAKIGDTATFQLADAAGPEMGSLTWNVLVKSNTKPAYKLRYTSTPQAPHSNSITIPTDESTKPGRYDIAVTVTSNISGLTSAPTELTLNAIYAFTTTADNYSASINDQQGEMLFATSYDTNASVLADFQTSNDGTTNIASVDATDYPPPPSLASFRRQILGHRQALQTSGSPKLFKCHMNGLSSAAYDGRIVLSGVSARCDKPGIVTALELRLLQTGINNDRRLSPNSTVVRCAPPAGPICQLSNSVTLPVQDGSALYSAEVIPILASGIVIDQTLLGKFTEDFAYNDNNAIYPQVYPYNIGQPVAFPGPYFYDCRQLSDSRKSALPSCPSYDSARLRRALIKAFGSGSEYIPPGVTPAASGPNYQPHHIKPGSCGGDDDSRNGSFLTTSDHQLLSTWFYKLAICGRNAP